MIRDFFVVNLQTKERFHKSYSKELTPESIVKSFLLKYAKEFETSEDDLNPIKNIPVKQFMFTFLVRSDLIFMIISENHDSKKDMELLLSRVYSSISDFTFEKSLSKSQREILEITITKGLFSQIKISLIGKDNVGKSTIFNQLEGEISYSHSKRVMRSKQILPESSDPKVYPPSKVGVP